MKILVKPHELQLPPKVEEQPNIQLRLLLKIMFRSLTKTYHLLISGCKHPFPVAGTPLATCKAYFLTTGW